MPSCRGVRPNEPLDRARYEEADHFDARRDWWSTVRRGISARCQDAAMRHYVNSASRAEP